MAGSWELIIPAPCAWLNSNDRKHFQAAAKLTQAWRAAGLAYARQAGIPQLQRAHIIAYVYKPRLGRYDPGNLYPTAKAVVDGLVDAGILPDDDWKHLDGPDMRHGGKGDAALRLFITKLVPANR